MREVTLIPGDGIGPDIVSAARRILDTATGNGIDWDVVEAGELAYERAGVAIPQAVLSSIQRTGIALQGPFTGHVPAYVAPAVEIRRKLGLTINVRVAEHFMGTPSLNAGTRITLIRDLAEDVSNGVQQWVGSDAGIAIKFTTRANSQRLARYALEFASKRRLRVTIAHHRTLFTTDGLYLASARGVAAEYPEVEVADEAMDSLCMHLVIRPHAYEVIVSPLVMGGIITGLCAGLIGTVGLMPGMSVGDGHAVFEAAHGSAPHYAGQNKVNPGAMILAGSMLLEHIGENQAALRVREAVKRVIQAGEHTTYDIGGSAGTLEMAEAVREQLGEHPPGSSTVSG